MAFGIVVFELRMIVKCDMAFKVDMKIVIFTREWKWKQSQQIAIQEGIPKAAHASVRRWKIFSSARLEDFIRHPPKRQL